MDRRSLVGRVVAVVVLAAACGGDGDRAAHRADDSAPVSSTTVEPSSWCNELSALLHADDITEKQIAGAPEEIADELRVLVTAAKVDPQTDPMGFTRLVSAYAAVGAWGHDHCGGEDPFCSLWITVEGTIAATALGGRDDEGATAALHAFLDGMEPVLADYVPSEMKAPLATFLTSVRSGGTSTQSDVQERAAEAAVKALDQWAWTHGCEGAAPPSEPD
jgi:hypothetical protein